MKALARGVSLSAVICLGLHAGSGQAVSPVSTSAPGSGSPCAPSGGGNSSTVTSGCAASDRFGQLLDGGKHFTFAFGGMGGRDTAFAGRKDLDASFDGAMLFTGFTSIRGRGFTQLKNTASVSDYHTRQRTIQYQNSTALSMSRSPSPRTNLTFTANNIFGNSALRIIELPDADGSLDNPFYGIHPGRVLDNQVTFGLNRQSTETRWWSIAVRNNFRDFVDDQSRVNTAHARAQLQYQPSPRAGIGLYEETSVERGIVDCSSQSVGAVYERQFSPSAFLKASAAPAIGTKGCVNRYTANMFVSLSLQPWRSANLWVSAYRRLNDSQFAALTYENNARLGLRQRLGVNSWLKAEGGWIGGTVTAGTASFHGTFVTATFARRLSTGLTASFSVQQSNWAGVSNIAPARTVVDASLWWSPRNAGSGEFYGPAIH